MKIPKYIQLNNEIMIKDSEGKMNLTKDYEAANSFFIDHINKNTIFFYTLEEKLNYLIKEGYYIDFLKLYSMDELKKLYRFLYNKKFRFQSYMSAYKFYNSYALKDRQDETKYLERYEDRIACVALFLGDGNFELAKRYATIMINQEYQPATPTFLNAGLINAGKLVSCNLIECADSLNDIGYIQTVCMKLSAQGAGVSINLTPLRGRTDPIKGREDVASGVLPVMKILEDTFSYANQLGQRPGAGAVYLNIFHNDIYEFLDSKKINVDEKIRIKTLSIGVCIPTKFMKLAEKDESFYTFSPYDVFKETGKTLDEINFDEDYNKLVDNPNIKKTKKMSARQLLVKIAQVQKESGYPYLFYNDNSNKVHALNNIGKVNFSNLCVAPYTKILTRHGYQTISDLKDRFIEIWNGEKWSNVQIKQTGKNQKLVRVTTNTGQYLDCTPYHKFYVQDSELEIIEKRAKELKKGDKLIKFKLPTDTIQKETSPRPYINGFFLGTYRDSNIFNNSQSDNILKSKFLLPHTDSTFNKIKWFEGFIDANSLTIDDNIYQSIKIKTIDKELLIEIQLMLQSIGVFSKISSKDSTDKVYKNSYELIIPQSGINVLLSLNIKPKYLNLVKREVPQEDTDFIQIESIEDLSGEYDTYCFTEPERHMGMFDGILTGQCTEIIQVSEPSLKNDDQSFNHLGLGISCNLGSLNIATVMENKSLHAVVRDATISLTTVTLKMNGSYEFAKDIDIANKQFRSIGLGAMNLHGFLAKNKIQFGSDRCKNFCDVFFMIMNYASIKTSMKLAKEYGSFHGFDNSKYKTGDYFLQYLDENIEPTSEKISELFKGIFIPTKEDWYLLMLDVQKYGLCNAYRLAIAPNQSSAYIMNSTPSVMPVVDPIEIREYGDSTTYYPMPYLTNDNVLYYKSAYDIDQFKLIEVISIIQKHIDQGISCILYTKGEDSTRIMSRLYIYAHKMGLKTLYYTRTRKSTITECISCSV